MKKSMLIAAALLVTPASARPPEGASSEFAPYYHALKQPITGYGCCDFADCRPVAIRFQESVLEAFIDKRSFGPSAPDAWVAVPEEVIIKDPPQGLPRPQEPILCYAFGAVRCFDNPGWGN